MAEIFCISEHRRGKLRDVGFEILGKARDLAPTFKAEVTAVLLGHHVDGLADKLKCHAHKVIVVDHENLNFFTSEYYQTILASLIAERNPCLTMIGHDSFGMELAPALAVEAGIPLATDCLDVMIEEGRLFAIRQMYSGKINAKVSFNKREKVMATIRPGAFPVTDGPLNGEILSLNCPLGTDITRKTFLAYKEAESGGVDITQFDKIVSAGRGIKKQENLQIVDELARAIGGVLACSRPIVDSGWLSSDRQVGQSGKSVKPKLYVAVGISGAHQHLLGMKGSNTIVAINKDPEAPIFKFADFGIVDDLFNILPLLNERIKRSKREKQKDLYN
jgi:electron transfer flavoprotein alpha subunit